jgi:hypothetical protein
LTDIPDLSWINQVERWFGFLTDQMIRRGTHTSRRSDDLSNESQAQDRLVIRETEH